MLKYAIVVDEESKLCLVGEGDNVEFYQSLGMTEQDVEQCWNGSWYLTGFAPQKPAPTHDEISKQREEYRKKHIDSKTAERSRRQANKTWTDEDEQAFLALDAEVTAYIEEHYPYPEESE